MRYAVLFPGQGSQFIGMGEDVFASHEDLLGDRATEILGWSLRDMCLAGPAEDLTRTEHAQPALYAVAYALWLSFKERIGSAPVVGAGHSLGEYTALAAAGALGFDGGLQLVAKRGELMARAADATPTGMAALLGANLEQAESVVAASESAGGSLQVANVNAPGQVVVAGSVEDLDWLEENGRDLGVRRVIRLKVAGAFHSSYMGAAGDALKEVVADVEFSDPEFEVVSNVTALPHQSGEIANSLVAQVTSTVMFEQSLESIARSGVETFIHIGPGDVTAGLAKRTIPEAKVFTVSSIDDIGPVVEAVGTIEV